MKTKILLALISLILCSCKTHDVRKSFVNVSSDAMVYCEEVSIIKDPSVSSITKKLSEVLSLYKICRSKQKELSDAIKENNNDVK